MKKTLMILTIMLFTTSAVFAAALNEGFEGSWPPADWTIINSTNSSNDISQSSTQAYSGTYSARFSSYYSGSPYDQYLITPQLVTTSGDQTISFWYRSYSSYGTEVFKVGWSTTGTNVATDFTWSDEIDDAVNTAWTQYSKTDLPIGTKYVAIHYYSNYQYYLYVDDVLGPELYVPACPKPTNLTTTNITQTTADLGWTEAGTATTWEYDYGVTGYGPPVGAGTSTTSNPVNITGLSPNTTYDWYVRANCGAKEVSDWAGPQTFTTLCAPVTTFPYTEGFEATVPPDCWSEVRTPSSSYGWASYATGYSGKCARFNSYFNSSGNVSELITNTFDLTSKLSTARLKFVFKNPTGGDFSVLLSTDGGSTYPNTLLSDLTGQTDWLEKTVDITSYIGSNVKIAFKGTSNYGSGDAYVYLDEVTVEEIPASPVISVDPDGKDFGLIIAGNTSDPQTFTISNVGGGTLTIASGGISLTGTDTDQFILTDTNTYPINLTSGQTADVDISFSPTAEGNKTANLTIADNRGTTDIPVSGDAVPSDYVFEGFENTTFPPTRWTTDGWTRSTFTVYEGNGSAYKYGSSSTQYTLYTMLLNINSGDKLYFWGRTSLSSGELEIVYSADGSSWTVLETVTYSATNTWEHKTVDLTTIAKSDVYVGFRTGLQYASFYVDNVIHPPMTLLTPEVPTNPSPADSATNVIEIADLEWTNGFYTQTVDVYFSTNETLVINKDVSVKVIDDLDVETYDPGTMTSSEEYFWRVVCKNTAKAETDGPVWRFTVRADPVVYSFPYLEDFETFTPATNATGYMNNWSTTPSETTTEFRWNVNSGSTISSSTGPSVDHTTGTTSGIYLFTESSSGATGDIAFVYSPPFDISHVTTPHLLFYYYMYGATMGELHVDAYQGGTWTNDVMTPIVGQQQTSDTEPWLQASVDLSAYKNKGVVYIRFRGIRGTSYTSDMAIDDVWIGNPFVPPAPPNNPDPEDDAVAVSITPGLSWVNGLFTDTIDLYFGTDLNLVSLMNPAVRVIAGQDTNAYNPGMLDYNTTYYWKVKAMNSNKAETVGPLWTFTTEQPPAPEILTTTASDAQIDLEWQEPLPTGEIKYDDGTAESWYWVGDPSSSDDYFYVRFNAPANGNLTHIAVFNASNGAAWNEIMICPDVGTGKPDLATPYQSFPNVPVTSTITQGGEWELLELTTPQGVAIGDTFYVVTRWPDASSTGPFVGTDTGTNAGRSCWTDDAGVTWNAFIYNFIMRSYMTTAKGETLTLKVDSSTENCAIPVHSIMTNNKVLGANTYRKSINAIATSYAVPRIIITTSAKNRTILGYRVYRGTETGVYSYLAFTGSLAYSDLAVSNMNEYFYVVSALYDIGESGYSNEASGVPQAAASVPYFSNFDAKDNGGFYGTGDWQNGAPTYVDGPAAYSAPNVWGTKLDTTYSANSNSWLIQPFDLTAKSGYKVNFFHWDSIETNWDYGYVAVDHDNDNVYDLLATFTGYQTSWTEEQVIIPDSLCSAYTKLAFIFTSDGTGQYPGFYIDNVGVDEYIPAQISVDPMLFSKSLLQNGSTADNLNIENVARGTQEDLDYEAVIVFGSKDRTDLINEDFSGGVPPVGWTDTDIAWSSSPTSNAGGASPEADLYWLDSEDGCQLYTNAINTVGYTTLTLQFRTFIDYYSTGVTMLVQTSTDAVTWNDVWSVSPTADYGPSLESINLDGIDGVGSATFYVSFTFSGSTWAFDDWYIDDVLLYGSSSAPWLTLDGGGSVSGSIPVSDSDDITVGFDATGLDTGIHTADIVITSNDPDNPSVTVPVTLEVAGPPAIDILVIDDGANVKLTWADEGYTYKVYSSTDPHAAYPGGWTYVTSVSGVGEVTLPAPAANTFYVVTASDDPPLALPANKVKANNNR